ncbi:MAG: tRNA (N6-threonylcarbamoyladenosine(37)-N6)-methyltransferase TrmO [Acutalibacteraceae bacterium]|nr:tRNA (N6-threonylcarbamoyladenosine(37)-N6)-methyltransferase TrmO [Acutalibacteraceae bacterium]
MKIIARIKSEFPEKFGIPRQSGLVSSLKAQIIFEEEYRNLDAVRGLDEFSHLWIIWQFSKAVRDTWSPTVRPPRLGGNKRIGVFATRSPFRPNAIGLSSVKIEKIDLDGENAPVIHVSGADLMDGTPIFDIKPYLAYTDAHPDAVGGFTENVADRRLKVEFDGELINSVPDEIKTALTDLLAEDPRPSYQNDSKRVYGLSFSGYEIGFTVDKKTLKVIKLEKS